MTSGGDGARTLSPVLAEAIAERLPMPRSRTSAGRPQCVWSSPIASRKRRVRRRWATRGDPGASRPVRREARGAGYGLRVAEVLRVVGTGNRPALDAILAAALVAVGDWDGAMEMFGLIYRNAAGAPLDAAIAWRFGALLYLRSDIEAAHEVLSAAYREGSGTSDDALVAAWLSSTLWGRGEVEDAANVADVALRKAEAAVTPPRAPPRTSPPLSLRPAGERGTE